MFTHSIRADNIYLAIITVLQKIEMLQRIVNYGYGQ